MASRITGVYFTVRITGAWRWKHSEPPEHRDPAVPARDHLRRQAGRVLSQHSILDPEAAQDAANTILTRWSRPLPGLEVIGEIRLGTPARNDTALAEEHTRRRQAADLAQEEELARLTHLQQVLADPDLRRVWWMARFPDRFTDLASLTEALQGLPLPRELYDDDIRGDIRRFTDQLVTELHTPEQRDLFLRALIRTLGIVGQEDLKTAAARWQTPTGPGGAPA